MAEIAGLKDEIQTGEERERAWQEDLRTRLSELPNLPADGVPDGADETRQCANAPAGASRRA